MAQISAQMTVFTSLLTKDRIDWARKESFLTPPPTLVDSLVNQLLDHGELWKARRNKCRCQARNFVNCQALVLPSLENHIGTTKPT